MTWCAHAEEVGVLKAANPLTNLQHVTPYFLNSLSEVEDKVRAQDLQRDEEKQKPLADRFRRLGNSPFLAIVFISLCLCPEYITMEKTKVPSHTHRQHTQTTLTQETLTHTHTHKSGGTANKPEPNFNSPPPPHSTLFFF